MYGQLATATVGSHRGSWRAATSVPADDDGRQSTAGQVTDQIPAGIDVTMYPHVKASNPRGREGEREGATGVVIASFNHALAGLPRSYLPLRRPTPPLVQL